MGAAGSLFCYFHDLRADLETVFYDLGIVGQLIINDIVLSVFQIVIPFVISSIGSSVPASTEDRKY